MKIRLALGLALAGLVWGALAAVAGINTTRHNLSATGPGTVKAATESEICIFCHAPHAAPLTPLWNHDQTAVPDYTSYWTPTLDAYASEAAAPLPDGGSKMCLSCHDGTIALGAVTSRTSDIAMAGGVTTMPVTSPGYVGTNISGSHPVSFVVTPALIAANNAKDSLLFPLASMQTDANGVRVDPNNKVQCTSCHDVHDDGNFAASGIPFWRKATMAAVCVVCHNV